MRVKAGEMVSGRVLLDGVEVKDAVHADDKAGFVETLVRGPDGKCRRLDGDPDGFLVQRLFGRVSIQSHDRRLFSKKRREQIMKDRKAAEKQVGIMRQRAGRQ